MMSYLGSFARSGVPHAPSLPPWDTHKPNTDRFMELGEGSRLAMHRLEERSLEKFEFVRDLMEDCIEPPKYFEIWGAGWPRGSCGAE